MVVRNSRVHIFEDRVEKFTGTPAELARKYAAVHEVAAANGFRAPQVLNVRPDRVVLERLTDMEPLESLYVEGDRQTLARAIHRAGEVLALLHADLPSSNAAEWSAPQRILGAVRRYLGRDVDISQLPHATLHGDYSFANVWFTRGSSQSIVIIDPCANFGSTFDDWTVAPVYVDVGKMLACLEGQIPLRRQHLRPSPSRVNELQRHFIEGYERFGPKLDVEMAHAFAFAVSSAQFYRRFGRLSALHRFALYNRFRGNFPASRKQGRAG